MVRSIAEAGRGAQLFGLLWRSCLLLCLWSYLCFSQTPTSRELGPLLTLEEALALATKQNKQTQMSALDVSKAVESEFEKYQEAASRRVIRRIMAT